MGVNEIGRLASERMEGPGRCGKEPAQRSTSTAPCRQREAINATGCFRVESGCRGVNISNTQEYRKWHLAATKRLTSEALIFEIRTISVLCALLVEYYVFSFWNFGISNLLACECDMRQPLCRNYHRSHDEKGAIADHTGRI